MSYDMETCPKCKGFATAHYRHVEAPYNPFSPGQPLTLFLLRFTCGRLRCGYEYIETVEQNLKYIKHLRLDMVRRGEIDAQLSPQTPIVAPEASSQA